MKEITPKEYMESFLHFDNYKIEYTDSYESDFYRFNIKVVKKDETSFDVPHYATNAYLIRNTSLETILKDCPYILADVISFTVHAIIKDTVENPTYQKDCETPKVTLEDTDFDELNFEL